MGGFAEEMAEYDDEFQETEAASGPAMFSDGKHQAVLTVARVEPGQYGWQLVLGWRGVDANSGQPASIRKWHNLPPEAERAPFLKQDLELLGYDGPLSGLEKACVDEQFIGLLCNIGVKTKSGAERDYTNVYINQVVEKVPDVEAFLESLGAGGGEFVSAGGGDESADDDIPFAPTIMTSGRWGI